MYTPTRPPSSPDARANDPPPRPPCEGCAVGFCAVCSRAAESGVTDETVNVLVEAIQQRPSRCRMASPSS